jgi:hypothetical protein
LARRALRGFYRRFTEQRSGIADLQPSARTISTMDGNDYVQMVFTNEKHRGFDDEADRARLAAIARDGAPRRWARIFGRFWPKRQPSRSVPAERAASVSRP